VAGALHGTSTKTEILNDILSSYINIDVRVLADFQKLGELQQLLRVLTRLGEGALFENAVFNQLRTYGEISYLARGSEYEIDFVVREPEAGGAGLTALEVKVNPLPGDLKKLRRLAARHALPQAHLVGRFPSPGFSEFGWGGLIF
jgi:Domain of unknown function (DUF4143)